MGEEDAGWNTMYGTLPVSRGRNETNQLQTFTISNTLLSRRELNIREANIGQNQQTQFKSHPGYSRNCQDILRKSRQNVNKANFSHIGPDLNNPYSRHSFHCFNGFQT